jgi:hypothetical protein
MGTVDRIVRVVIAVVFDIIMLLTSITAVCPLYWPLGISTMKKKKK